jgi:hypothetical protein
MASNLKSALGKAQPAPPGGIRSPGRNLDVAAEFNKIRGLYSDHGKVKKNFLIIGDHGSGKTYGLRYAPAPVFIHSFDPGGTSCIPESEITSGRVLPVTVSESEDASAPKAFRAWETEFLRLKDTNFFDNIGTYSIDSHTLWARAMMNEILKGRSRKIPRKADFGRDPDIVPEMGDYNVHQKTIHHYLSMITSLPCNVVICAHLNVETNDDGKPLLGMVMMDGRKFAQAMPSLFDEVYFADSKPAGPGKRSYFYRLVKQGIRPARSRLRQDGAVLGETEPQNIKEILKKAGYPYEDKPLFI